jgi:uncharacterized membrane protein YvlD (DUF360 family)
MTSGERITVGFLTLIIIASCLFVTAIGLEEHDTAVAVFGAASAAVWTPVAVASYLMLDRAFGQSIGRTDG